MGALVPAALRAVAPGGTVVCAGIHMSDIPSFPYRDLWQERVLRSVANLTRADAEEFLALAPRVPVRTTVTAFALEAAETALERLRAGEIEGAAVVQPTTVADMTAALLVMAKAPVPGRVKTRLCPPLAPEQAAALALAALEDTLAAAAACAA